MAMQGTKRDNSWENNQRREGEGKNGKEGLTFKKVTNQKWNFKYICLLFRYRHANSPIFLIKKQK